MSLPLPNLALILAGRALRDVLNGWDRALQLADCRDLRDVVCMALAYSIVYVPLVWALWP